MSEANSDSRFVSPAVVVLHFTYIRANNSVADPAHIALLTERLEQQMKLTQNIMDDFSDTMTKLTKTLSMMKERFEAQSFPTVAATSPSAWTPLVRDHHERIQPTVEKWRGILDTILIFVALFSAVITTFMVQSMGALSDNPVNQTNQYLANITQMLLFIHREEIQGVNFMQRAEFKPDPSVVRTNVFWSLALIASISIACLAVTSRALLAKLSRSYRASSHQQLVELKYLWRKAERFLRPTIESLLQGLVIPVVFFSVGLLDTLMSTSLPLSHPFIPVFIGGVLSLIGCALAGIYTAYILLRGSFNALNHSPLALQLLSWFVPGIVGDNCDLDEERPDGSLSDEQKTTGPTSVAPAAVDTTLIHREGSVRNPDVFDTIDVEGASDNNQKSEPFKSWIMVRVSRFLRIRGSFLSDSEVAPMPTAGDAGRGVSLDKKQHASFHSALCEITDDDVLDKAVAALPSLLDDRRRNAVAGQKLYAASFEVKTLQHLLSIDVSVRCNLAAAAYICTSLCEDRFKHLPAIWYTPKSVIDLIDALCLAAERHHETSTQMSKSILLLLDSLLVQTTPECMDGRDSYDCIPDVPLLTLLFTPFACLPLENPLDCEHVRSQVVDHVYRTLSRTMADAGDSSSKFKFSNPQEPTISCLYLLLVEMGMNFASCTMFEIFPLQTWNQRSTTPFLLNIMPHKHLGKSDGEHYDVFKALIPVIFTSGISRVRLFDVVNGVRIFIEYHRDKIVGDSAMSLDLFLATDIFLSTLHVSLLNDETSNLSTRPFLCYHLSETCLCFIQHLFDPKHFLMLKHHYNRSGTNSFWIETSIGAVLGILEWVRGALKRSTPDELPAYHEILTLLHAGVDDDETTKKARKMMYLKHGGQDLEEIFSVPLQQLEMILFADNVKFKAVEQHSVPQ
ncbi:hypothetical protein H0H93_015321 [Arthromyces matolae]|nr:hypothetical protein H0H93_015321 [Arthromyces matolae]